MGNAAVAEITAGQRSAAAAVHEALQMQPGTAPLSAEIMLKTTREKCDELETIARAAQQLKGAFMDIESLVDAQGDVIDEIGRHVAIVRDETEQATHQLAH